VSRRVFFCVSKTALVSLLALWAAVPNARAQADVQGQWNTANYMMTINPIHVALMHNGKILVTAGSGNCPSSQAGCPSGAPYGGSNHSGAVVVDPAAQSIAQLSIGYDIFCNGMTVLPDGRVIVVGGTTAYDPFKGSPQSSIFDPGNNSFSSSESMAHGRWYPSVITLGDGRVMAFSGSNESSGSTNNTVEFYTVGAGWSQQFTAPWTPPLYPRLHLLPNGKVFASGSQPNSNLFTPSSTSWTLNIASTNYGGTRTYGSSVLLPLTPANNYDPVVIIFGGNDPSTSTTELIDLGSSSPHWSWGPDMSQPRIEMDAVMLPTGKILAVGGSANDENAATASLNADLYDPANNSFSSGGANVYARLYHTVALLLPDATVWLAGGNPTRGSYESHVEIYKPAYLFTRDGNNNVVAATRPSIASAPGNIAWGGSFTVSTPDAANISQVVLVRPGSSTHSFDFDQRLVGMSFTAGSGTLNVTAPPNGNIAPPGYYMLFLINSKGVPSVASFLLLNGSAGAPAPTVASVSPNSGPGSGGTGVTITGANFSSGATVTFGSSTATSINVVSSTSITAKTPSHAAGSVKIVVTNSDSQSGSLNNGYSYGNPAPSVSAISPNTGPASGGTAVTITGTGFLAGATVSIGGTAATGVNVASSTSITAMTAVHAAGAVSVVVTNSDAQSSTLSNGYTYVAAPTVTALTPGTGPTTGGTGLTITGTGFQSGATVSVGGTAATGLTVVSNTSITATAPPHSAGTVDVIVTNSDGQSGKLAGGYAYAVAQVSLALGVPYGDPNAAIVAAGQTASYTLSIGGGGMSGTATLTCTGAPVGAACVLPGSQKFNATTPTTFVIKVATTARLISALTPPASTPSSSTPASWLWTIALGMLFVPGTRAPNGSARRWRRYLRLVPLLLLFFSISCGGGGMGSGPSQQTGTPAGTYNFVVHATSNSTTGTTSLTLNVQ
jgi:hypothetical protein